MDLFTLNKTKFYWNFLSLACFYLFVQLPVLWAAADRIDLSLGVAEPSLNGAITENPAALAKGQDQVFDLEVLPNGGTTPNVSGSFASGNGGFGYGLKILEVNSVITPSIALGVGNGSTSLGVGATTSLNNFAPIFDLGFLQVFPAVTLGLFFHNLSAFGNDWTIAFATTSSTFARLGVDCHFTGISSAILIGALELFADQKFTLKLSYSIEVVPVINTSIPGFSGGLNVFVSPKNSFYALYNVGGVVYTFGMKYFF